MDKLTIDNLKFDDKNFNKHTQKGLDLLEKSVSEHKFGRSILVDKDNNIIAGNGIVETAKKVGKTKIKVIETTGDELVVVKRTDVDINTKQGREMALADNATSAIDLSWDDDMLLEVSEQYGIDVNEWEVPNFDEWEQIGEVEGEVEEPDLDAPIKFSVLIPFELKNREQEIKDCVNDAISKYDNVTIK
jgi:hypothetical protein